MRDFGSQDGSGEIQSRHDGIEQDPGENQGKSSRLASLTRSIPTYAKQKPIEFIQAFLITVALIASLLAGTFWIMRNPDWMARSSIVFVLCILLWAVLDLSTHVVLFVFQAAYFVFIFGRVFAVLFLGADTPPYGGGTGAIGIAGTYGTNPEHVTNSFGLFFVFDLVLVVTYQVVFFVSGVVPKPSVWQTTTERKPRYVKSVVQLSTKWLFYLSVPFAVINAYFAISFVRAFGYLEYAQVRNEVTPAIFMYGSEFSLVVFFGYLATLPKKRDLVVPGAVFVVSRSLLVLTGNRSSVILPLVAFFVYIVSRRIDWKSLLRRPLFLTGVGIGAVVLVSVGINMISLVNEARGTGRIGGGPLTSALVELGVTGNLPILLTEKGILERIPSDKIYSLGPFINFFKLRILGTLHGDGRYDYLIGVSEEQALKGNSFAHTFSYFYMGEKYIDGAGFGSSAAVELWVDAGMLGVIVGAVIYGVLFLVLQRLVTRPFWPALIALLAIQRVPWTPRASYSEIFFSFNARVLASLVLLALILELVFFLQKKKQSNPGPLGNLPKRLEIVLCKLSTNRTNSGDSASRKNRRDP